MKFLANIKNIGPICEEPISGEQALDREPETEMVVRRVRPCRVELKGWTMWIEYCLLCKKILALVIDSSKTQGPRTMANFGHLIARVARLPLKIGQGKLYVEKAYVKLKVRGCVCPYGHC